MLVDAAQFGWMIPFAIGGLSAGYWRSTSAWPPLSALSLGRDPAGAAPGSSLFAVAWIDRRDGCAAVSSPAFRGTSLGYRLGLRAGDHATRRRGGIWGLSLITVLVAALPAMLGGPPRRAARLRPRAGGGGAGGLLLWLGGAGRLAPRQAAVGDVPRDPLRLVQPAIAQTLKWDAADAREANLNRHVDLTVAHAGICRRSRRDLAGDRGPVPAGARSGACAAMARPGGAAGGLLITGAPRAEPPSGDRPASSGTALEALDHDGQIVGELRQVPPGAASASTCRCAPTLPLRQQDHPGRDRFLRRPGPRTLPLPGLPPVGAADLLRDHLSRPGGRRRRTGPAWLLNLTNDAWFGTQQRPLPAFRQRRGSARSRRACRWSARPIRESRRRRSLSAGSSAAARPRRERQCSTRRCPGRLPADALRPLGDWTLLVSARACLRGRSGRSSRATRQD